MQQLIYPDPQGLSGASVFAFVNPLSAMLPDTMVLASDLEGAKLNTREITGGIPAREFPKWVAKTAQFDWAFFHYLPDNQQGFLSLPDRERIARSLVTVRLADDSYVYLYTENADIAREMKNLFPTAQVADLSLDRLEIMS